MLPVPGEQLVQLRGGMISDAVQDVGEPSLWVDAIEFCRGDQGVHRGGPLTATVGTGE